MKPEPRYEKNELQHPGEFALFVQLLINQGVRRYLEIGSCFGGSLWAVAQGLLTPLQPGIELTAVDLQVTPELEACSIRLFNQGFNVLLIEGDSTAPDVIERVRRRGPYDAVLIDGKHEMEYVRQDWENYGPMARIVAFHDASPGPIPENKPWKRDAWNFFDALRADYRTEIIKLSGGIGFGIVFRE